jgi:hypothetical protein
MAEVGLYVYLLAALPTTPGLRLDNLHLNLHQYSILTFFKN